MELLDKLVLPQSAHHMVLLKYLLALTNFIFLSYLCVLIGTTIYSLYFKKKSFSTGDNKYLNLAKELVNILTVNRVMAIGLGIIPLISIAFGYLQLLHESAVNLSGILLLSLISLIIGLVLVYAYRQNLTISQPLNIIEDDPALQGDNIKKEIRSQKIESKRIYEIAGKFGLIFLLIASYLFAGATKLAEDTARWDTSQELISSIFSFSTLIYFLLIVCLGMLSASSVVLYFYFRPNSEYSADDGKYLAAIKNFANKNGLISSLLIPVLIALLVISFDVTALNYSIFILAIVVFMIIVLISSQYYLMLKNSTSQYSLSILFLMIILFLSVVGVNISAFDTATKLQFNQLSKKYDAHYQQLLIESGVAVVTASGEDIFNGRCIACHKFDQKLVGPPYNEVLPKYASDRTSLIKFVLNPVKVNPEYPPMPNQGLKPKEAEAIADYILSMYSGAK